MSSPRCTLPIRPLEASAEQPERVSQRLTSVGTIEALSRRGGTPPDPRSIPLPDIACAALCRGEGRPGSDACGVTGLFRDGIMGPVSRLLTGFVVVAFVAAACSSGSGTSPQGSVISERSRTIDMLDYRFAPVTVTLPSGTPVELVLRNLSSVVHNWTVLAEEITAESEFDETMVLFTNEVSARGLERTMFQPPPPGAYQVICTISTHFTLGMVGSLVVENQ